MSAEELRVKPVNIFSPDSAFMRDEVKAIWTIIILWALASYGFILLLWAVGTKGDTIAFEDQAAWEDRVDLVPSELPGTSGLTDTQVLGFPFHWGWTALGTILVFIILVIIYNLWYESIERKHGVEFRERAEVEAEMKEIHGLDDLEDREGGGS